MSKDCQCPECVEFERRVRERIAHLCPATGRACVYDCDSGTCGQLLVDEHGYQAPPRSALQRFRAWLRGDR